MRLRELIHRFVPVHFRDPLGLFLRLARSKDRSAWFAVATALLGVLLTPMDSFLQISEKKFYQRATKPERPIILVCGAPRTGTTLVAQVLINHLPVSYLNNLTSLFPRSPIVANRIFGRFLKVNKLPYKSYFGKSYYLHGPNDALYIWDRWLGSDRTRIRSSLTESEKKQMVQFFGAYEAAFERPFVNKNNNLNVEAHLISEILETAYFICMTRDPAFLAQSLLEARLEIHGDEKIPYGIDNPRKPQSTVYNLIQDVCDQVMFHERIIREQEGIIGPDRFRIVSYEDFCQNPGELLARVTEDILGNEYESLGETRSIEPFKINNTIRLESALFEEIERTLVIMKGNANL